ncbi:MFS sugar transporter-like protein [Microdochium trichocladiopsis]|uniref:MFS sugar transporter-like protein n=1 Tax=Microdochium trichocladiopsis TaxID=1682393 RepID=A0A9P8Y0Y5_9PEZI|nr:MFS sugar transporter-like protein [Microdochium trichocladiopsis]KAH7024817.1 MFS sugar transporter-like protein [Microdochium trichocladiopsis]
MASTANRASLHQWLPKSSAVTAFMVVGAACVTSTTKGYDGSMMQSLNELPSYSDYFVLNTATKALNTTAVWLGGIVSAFVAGPIANRYGRRRSLRWASLFTIFGAILQAAAQNVPMWVVSRMFIGFGITFSMIAATAYTAETLPVKWRGWGVGLLGDLYYVGGFLAAGITYGTSKMDSTWAWRLPSALQALFSILALGFLFVVPESPRWLIMQDRNEEALQVLALMNSDGDSAHPDTLAAYQEIMDAKEFERTEGRQVTLKHIAKTPDLRMRLILVLSASVCAMLSGNNVVSFYLGDMLTNAGITDSNTQLEITIVLNAWCLVVSIIGTRMLDQFGRKKIAIISNSGMVVLLFVVGALTAVYGTSGNLSGIYGTVASIFLFQGVYSLAWTPLIMLYPPEIMNYNMRVLGVGLMELLGNCFGLLIVFAFPFAFAAIGWKFYMINGAWNVLEVAFVAYFWIETKGLSLEEIDDKFLAIYGKTRTLEGLETDEKTGTVSKVHQVPSEDAAPKQ